MTIKKDKDWIQARMRFDQAMGDLTEDREATYTFIFKKRTYVIVVNKGTAVIRAHPN